MVRQLEVTEPGAPVTVQVAVGQGGDAIDLEETIPEIADEPDPEPVELPDPELRLVEVPAPADCIDLGPGDDVGQGGLGADLILAKHRAGPTATITDQDDNRPVGHPQIPDPDYILGADHACPHSKTRMGIVRLPKT